MVTLLDHANVAAQLLASGTHAAPALHFRDETVTYGALREQVASLAAQLRDAGARPGDRIGLLSDNSPLFVVGYLATIWGGMVSVPLPGGCDEATFAKISAATEMSQLIVQEKHRRRIQPWLTSWDPKRIWTEERIRQPGSRVSHTAETMSVAANVDPRTDLAAIIFTSGSTGSSKGVMISHRNIACNTADIIHYLSLTPYDRVLAVLPFSYCFGASLLHTHLAVGGSVVLAESFMFPDKVLDELAAKNCTGFAGVPSTYQILLRKTGFAQRSFPALRWLQQAGGKLPDAIIRELRAAHPALQLFIMYGQTEATARLSYLPTEALDHALGSIGRGLPSTRLEVLRPDGTPVQPGSDDVGEIVASGDNIALGYWNDPSETASYFVDGKLRTGDLARVDRDGFIYIVDRARDFIKSMGNRVSSKEIEDVLAEHPSIVEAAVVGAPDSLWGEAICAFVVARDGSLTEQALKEFCSSRLPSHKAPQRVVLVDELPKNTSGKVLKVELRSLAAEQQSARS